MKRALIIVDVQNDFMPLGGSLPVPDGHLIVPFINRILPKFETVVFTCDWHPANHCSFKENGGLWPAHCVQDTPGALFHESLKGEDWDLIISKGTNPAIDSYSAFFDNDHKTATELHENLTNLGVTDLVVCGLATDYCVKFTVLDALQLGYKVSVFKDGCRGLDKAEEALLEMKQKGATIVENETSL